MEESKEKSGTECREDSIRAIRVVAKMVEETITTYYKLSLELARLIIENPNESKAVFQCDDRLRNHYIEALFRRDGMILANWINAVGYKEEKSLFTDEKLDDHPAERCQDIGMLFEKIRKT